MDAQALLTPDAIEHVHGRAAGARAGARTAAPHPTTRATSPALFLETFAGLGIHPHLYWMSEQYGSGDMDPYIAKRARQGRRDPGDLPHRQHRQPPRRLAAGQRDLRELRQDRHDPRARLGRRRRSRTSASPTSSTGRRGCGFNGRVSPFGGRAKLVWNVDWAARWGLVGATIEGCGKDLATAGGSRDRADAISRRVFEREPPLNIPYEFLNIGGRKMSTSQGRRRGRARDRRPPAADAVALPLPALPAEPRDQLRSRRRHDPAPLRRVRPHRRFDRGQAHARRAAARSGADLRAQPGRSRAPTRPPRRPRFRPAFGHLALLLQVPGAGRARAAGRGEGRAARRRASRRSRSNGSPRPRSGCETSPARGQASRSSTTRCRLTRRRADGGAARLPRRAGGRRGEQRPDRPARHGRPSSSTLPSRSSIKAGEAFAAVYRAFLDRPNGPRAGWLLASLDRAFVDRSG